MMCDNTWTQINSIRQKKKKECVSCSVTLINKKAEVISKMIYSGHLGIPFLSTFEFSPWFRTGEAECASSCSVFLKGVVCHAVSECPSTVHLALLPQRSLP